MCRRWKMEVYTYTQARQRLAELLERAEAEGEVRIKRRDGRVFVVRPERRKGSPLAVQGLDLGMTAEEIMQYIREGRERPGAD
jgi:prevent-host-death family protein